MSDIRQACTYKTQHIFKRNRIKYPGNPSRMILPVVSYCGRLVFDNMQYRNVINSYGGIYHIYGQSGQNSDKSNVNFRLCTSSNIFAQGFSKFLVLTVIFITIAKILVRNIILNKTCKIRTQLYRSHLFQCCYEIYFSERKIWEKEIPQKKKTQFCQF